MSHYANGFCDYLETRVTPPYNGAFFVNRVPSQGVPTGATAHPNRSGNFQKKSHTHGNNLTRFGNSLGLSVSCRNRAQGSGWTAFMIKTHLGKPDEQKSDPSGRLRKLIKFYRIDRVHTLEASTASSKKRCSQAVDVIWKTKVFSDRGVTGVKRDPQ